MPNMLTISDIMKILIKRTKSIFLLTLLIAVLSVGIFLYSKSGEPRIIYEEKIYGLINFTDQNIEDNINATLNTIHDIYKSDALKASLDNLDYSNISDSFFEQYDLDKTDKVMVADFIYDRFNIEFNDMSKVFFISLQGNNEETVKYISEYIYNAGVRLTQTYLNTNIVMFDEQISTIENKKDNYSIINIIEKFILFFVAAFIIIYLINIFILVLTDKIISVNQLRNKYNIDILSIIKEKKNDYDGLKSSLLYKLNKKNIKSMIFLSSNNKDYTSYINGFKKILDDEGRHTAIVIVSDKTMVHDALTDVYYMNNLNMKNNIFWNELESSYQFIFILVESSLSSYKTQELITKYRNIVLIEKCFESKDEQIERTIEKLVMYDSSILGFIIFE